MLRADLRRDYVLTHVVRLSDADSSELEQTLDELEARGARRSREYGLDLEEIRCGARPTCATCARNTP